MLPASIPLFPLPNVVLFPNVFLPLHIFERRYRQMVADALDGDRIIGMTLLRPGYEANYEGRPSIYDIGCAGVITHSQPLADGPPEHHVPEQSDGRGHPAPASPRGRRRRRAPPACCRSAESGCRG